MDIVLNGYDVWMGGLLGELFWMVNEKAALQDKRRKEVISLISPFIYTLQTIVCLFLRTLDRMAKLITTDRYRIKAHQTWKDTFFPE